MREFVELDEEQMKSTGVVVKKHASTLIPLEAANLLTSCTSIITALLREVAGDKESQDKLFAKLDPSVVRDIEVLPGVIRGFVTFCYENIDPNSIPDIANELSLASLKCEGEGN